MKVEPKVNGERLKNDAVANILSIFDSYHANQTNFRKLENFQKEGLIYQGVDVAELGQRIRFHNLKKITELEKTNEKVIIIENQSLFY